MSNKITVTTRSGRIAAFDAINSFTIDDLNNLYIKNMYLGNEDVVAVFNKDDWSFVERV